jgi:hypothetical protein
MNCAKNSPNSFPIIVICLLMAIWLPVACTSTIVPAKVKAATASYDGGQQNSGFIAFAPDHGGYITPHARDRYNALVADYGNQFSPALQPDIGLAPATNNWHIDAQHLFYYATMNRWRTEGKPKSN